MSEPHYYNIGTINWRTIPKVPAKEFLALTDKEAYEFLVAQCWDMARKTWTAPIIETGLDYLTVDEIDLKKGGIDLTEDELETISYRIW